MTQNNPTEAELREQLAAIEHERWSDWQRWCHKVLRENCPSAELEIVLQRWDKQIATPYSLLTAAEKASDMEQVNRYWPLIEAYIAQTKEAWTAEARISELEQNIQKGQQFNYTGKEFEQALANRLAELRNQPPTVEGEK